MSISPLYVKHIDEFLISTFQIKLKIREAVHYLISERSWGAKIMFVCVCVTTVTTKRLNRFYRNLAHIVHALCKLSVEFVHGKNCFYSFEMVAILNT